MKRWLIFGLMSQCLWAAPAADDVLKVVEAAGIPREMAQLRNSQAFPEVAAIGCEHPDRGLELKAIYFEGRYCSPNQATAGLVGKLDGDSAVAWVTQVLLSFEQPCLSSPGEFVGLTTYLLPQAQPDGAGGFKVRLWVREARGGEFTLRQYHLTPQGVRLTIQQRWRAKGA
jgi:hypothetical protein